MKKIIGLTLLLIITFVLAACGASEPLDADPIDEQPTVDPQPINDNFVYGEAMVDSVELRILESFPVQVHLLVSGYLGDGCTALHELEIVLDEHDYTLTLTTRRDPELMCTQALVPFEEQFSLPVYGLPAGDYTVTVNGVSESFQLDIDNALPESKDNPAVEALVITLSEELDLMPEAINVMGVRSTEWPDGCLGVYGGDVACIEVITPGYIIHVEIEGYIMTYHTNADGSSIVLAQSTQ